MTTSATPATYAFAIWSFIFLASLGYAIFTLRVDRTDPLLRRVGWWSAAAFVLDAAWGVVQQVQGVTPLTVVLIVAIGVCAVCAFRPVALERRLSVARVWLVAVPIGVLAGWISAATPVNVNQALTFAHVTSPLSDTAGSIATIVASAAIVAALLRPLRAHPVFVAPAAWALVGVAVADVTRTPDVAVASVALLLAVLVVTAAAAVGTTQRRRLTA